MNEQIVGIMGAMPEEIDGFTTLMSDVEEVTIAGRTYFLGKINGIKVVLVFSRWGKIAAAITTTTLICAFKVTSIIFTGVAGAIAHKLKIGDIVIGRRFIQHDLDSRPMQDQFEIPVLRKKWLEANETQINCGIEAVRKLLNDGTFKHIISKQNIEKFSLQKVELYDGDIASGDKFFANLDEKMQLHRKLPTVLCVEMEGAAVAQVCVEHSIPFLIIRTISDIADENSPLDFMEFVCDVANKYSISIIKNIFGL